MKTKLKVKKAASKRFKITGTGRVMRRAKGMRHLLEHKSSGKKRQKRRPLEVHPSDQKNVDQMLGIR